MIRNKYIWKRENVITQRENLGAWTRAATTNSIHQINSIQGSVRHTLRKRVRATSSCCKSGLNPLVPASHILPCMRLVPHVACLCSLRPQFPVSSRRWFTARNWRCWYRRSAWSFAITRILIEFYEKNNNKTLFVASQRQRYRFDSSEIFLLGKLGSIALRVPFVNRIIKLNNRAVTISMLESNWFCISFVTRLA